jgi:two-component system, NarL family, sensor histidine kinase DegS
MNIIKNITHKLTTAHTIFCKPHFWILLVIFALLGILHYPHLLFPLQMVTGSLFGLQRHAIERILFLVPVSYAAYVFGFRGGILCLVVSLFIMLPRVAFISLYPRDALFETALTAGIGVLINVWLESRRREIGRREQLLIKLEASKRELQSHVSIINESKKSISALYSISTIINRSLILEEVLDITTDKIKELMDIDIVLIYFFTKDSSLLELKSHRGGSEEFISHLTSLERGEGCNGYVARTGESLWGEDASREPEIIRKAMQGEGITSLGVVPLKSKDNIVGTLCIAKNNKITCTPDKKKLLTLIGIELGVAAEKAFFLQELQRIGNNLRLYADQICNAYEEERKRIARELHDDTIQTFVAISRNLDNYITRNAEKQKGSLTPLEHIHKNIDEALVRVRRFVQDLRPPTLEYLGLLSALRELAKQTEEQSGIVVRLKAEDLHCHLTPEKELLVYRIVQEAIRNVWKHSGAEKAEIIIQSNDERTEVEINDNGNGFEVNTHSSFLERGKLGLMGMKERAHLLGGSFSISSKPGKGTTVSLALQHGR